MKKILLMSCCLLIGFGLYAQQRTVSGKVTDGTDGSPLPGVSILIKGTNTGSSTDSDGNFSVNASSGDILVFSFIGFEQQETTVGERTTIEVSLKASISELQEVVVIGYGEKSKAMLTESIGTVTSKQIQQLPVASADAAIQGRISGVQVGSVDGTPGSPVAIRIRGVGTVGNTAPLIVIDGIPTSTNLVNGTFDESGTNPLASLNPSDIESVSVLKDASAASVYGVRAANGVILITTKRGKSGKPRITLDSYYGVQNFPKDRPQWNSTAQYVALTQEANKNFNAQTGGALVLHPHLQPGSPYLNVNTDWENAAVVKNAPITNTNVGISGGTDVSNYYISLGYFKQDATVPKWDLERYSFRANSDYKIGSRLKVGQTFSLSYQEVHRGHNNSGDGFIYSSTANMPPFFSIYDDPANPIAGNRYGFNGNNNVAGLTVHNNFGINAIEENYDRLYRVLGGIYGELEIIKGLKYKSSASVDFNYGHNTGWNPGYTVAEIGIGRPQQFGDGRNERFTQIFTNTLTYANTIGDHNFNILAGYEFQKIRSNDLGGQGRNFLSADPGYYQSVKNAGELSPTYSAVGNDAYIGIIGRLSYDYKSKYILTASVRRDGTAHFAPENRWGTFPSFSAAWRVSQENFFSSISFINDLKIRGGWGQLGNSSTAPFPHLVRFSATPDYGSGNTGSQAPIQVNYTNPDIKWETVESMDIGFDASFFDSKVSLLATYYDRRTKDFLFGLPIPILTGFSNMAINAGEVRNSGIELELGYNGNIGDDVHFTVTGNFTTVKNRLVSLAPGIEEFSSGDYRTAIGYPIGYFYGYEMLGIYQNAGQAGDALPDETTANDPRPGDAIFSDNNGPAPSDAPEGRQYSGVPDGKITPADRTYLGKTIPSFYYGISINANYKGFDVSLMFQGVGDVQVYNEFRASNESLTGGGRNQMSTSNGFWTGENSTNKMPRAVASDPYGNNRFSSRWVEDASFLRFKNIQIGYTIPSALLSKTKSIGSARIYVAATNILTITDYTGLDPEVVTYGQSTNQLGAGTDSGNIPQPRVIQAGIQLQF
jgi:TonB-linked SusC/RagA family outer membrane protein